MVIDVERRIFISFLLCPLSASHSIEWFIPKSRLCIISRTKINFFKALQLMQYAACTIWIVHMQSIKTIHRQAKRIKKQVNSNKNVHRLCRWDLNGKVRRSQRSCPSFEGKKLISPNQIERNETLNGGCNKVKLLACLLFHFFYHFFFYIAISDLFLLSLAHVHRNKRKGNVG